jgi:hypothetical protein
MIRRFLSGKLGSLGTGFAALLLLLLVAQCGMAQSTYAPLFRANWKGIAPEGFGDRQNSWAWSMAWYNGNLLVGTARSEQCITDLSEHEVDPSYPYPPADPDIVCAAENDLMLQA